LPKKKDIEAKYQQKILAKIAHEFKTPLITITSLIGRINKFDLQIDSKTNKLLHHIDNLSNYVICLVSDIIQYVSNNVNMRIHKTKVSLNEVLDFCFKVLKTLVECNENKCNRVESILDFEEDLYNFVIETDEHRLKQLILNLISNAVKFTQSGSIKLKAKKCKDSGKLVISIKDTGIGIKNEDKHLIFLENTQLRMDDDYNHQGSGLGLSISKQLANMLNFMIGFKSELGKGSKFYIEIYQFSLNESILKLN
jgi:signal transduction histidine kinase